MTLLIWLIGGVLALGQLASNLPPSTWWLLPLALVWMIGLVPAAIFSMHAAHPFRQAFRNAMEALRQYLFVMALICVPAIVLAFLASIAN